MSLASCSWDGSGELVLHDPDGDGQLNVIAISETIVGEWTLEGNPIEGEGEFYITLLPGLFTHPLRFWSAGGRRYYRDLDRRHC